ncbi:MAG: hypothetical protein HC945_04205 [Nitrosarchaeum sp.]|nr:hypothetical protein [Nitrosarchaeum sp.]
MLRPIAAEEALQTLADMDDEIMRFLRTHAGRGLPYATGLYREILILVKSVIERTIDRSPDRST